MRKKVLALVLALVMVIAMLPTVAFAADYADTTGNWAEASIDRWTDAGIIEGNPDGTFAPDNNLKRSEFAKTMTNLMKITETADLSVYTDVDPNGWYVEALEGVVAKGIMKGTSDTTLSPDNNLTREQMFVMIGRALGVEPAETCEKDIPDSETASDWSIGYINALVNMGVINGIDAAGDVAPLADIQRGATMAVLDRLIGGYANEDGQTVTIVPGKITLVVADEVKVEGTADPDLPIVVAGGAAKVDMEGVEGEATVQVQVSDVAIENAPVGTEIVADETTTGVTANGIDVSGDADKDVVIPEPTTPAPSTPSTPSVVPSINDSTTAGTIDNIIEAGRVEVNKKMMVRESEQPTTIAYAVIPEFEKTGDPREVSVTIYDGDTEVGTVYTDIIDTLVSTLKDNAAKVTSITATTPIDGAELTGDDGVAYKRTLELSGDVTPRDVVLFVKALVGTTYTRGSKIGTLVGDSFTVTVSDAGKDDVTTTVSYKVTFKMASLDDVIADKIDGIEAKMDYATLDWDADSRTLNVDIDSSKTTDVNKVYEDIAPGLCDAFNLVRKQLHEVKDALNTESGTPLDIQDAIKDTDLLDFIKGLKLVNSLDSQETKALTEVLATGKTSLIAALKGYQFEINVKEKDSLPTGASSGTQKYTIKFIAPALDTVIDTKIKEIDAEINYAKLTWTTEDHTLKVEITDGNTQIGTVYDDIQKMLCDAFNESRNTLASVKDAIATQDEATLNLNTALDGTELARFVKLLNLQKTANPSEEKKTAGELLKDNVAIEALDGYEFKVNVTEKGAQKSAVAYTISFTIGA